MDYRDILGFSKKQKPKKKIIKEVVKEKPKSTVTDILKEKFGDTINEGPAAEYAKSHQRIKKAYTEFWDSIADFQRLLIKKGLKPIARQVDKSYSGVDKFWKFYHKILDKLL